MNPTPHPSPPTCVPRPPFRRYSDAEPLYVRSCEILLSVLGQEHPNTQTVIGTLIQFLLQVMAENRTAELSDAPITQQLLAVLLNPP
ncbi:hypothetical protein [Neosynechococcus sphagnicola]|uniref:hypothetical protein n=1 Tax=Neosynechococcus sphagnicola TaxID=1501145 RepID=UPI0012E0360D|nr:hypothetical protein [Neosynechococcus sphagnicola]